MNKNDDEMKRDNPFDESFYTLPEDMDDVPAMEEDSVMDDSLDSHVSPCPLPDFHVGKVRERGTHFRFSRVRSS